MDGTGNIYVADYNNGYIRKITSTGVVSTFAGSTRGFNDATGEAARFNGPYGVAVFGTGNNRRIYVADTANHTIRKIEEYK